MTIVESDNHRLTLLQASISSALIQDIPMSDMLRLSAQALVDHLDAAFARIWTLNESENVLELRASAGMYTHINGPHSVVPVGEYKIGKIAQERTPHLTNSVIGDPRVHDQEWARRESMVSFAGYPLVVKDKLVGVLAMFSRKALPEAALDALAIVSKYIGLAIHKKRIEESLVDRDLRLRSALNQKNAYLAVLYKVVTAAGAGSAEDSIKATLEAVCDLTGWSVGHSYLIDLTDGGKFLSSTQWVLKRPDLQSFKKATEETELRITEGLPGMIFAAGKAVWLSDLTDPASFRRGKSAKAAGLAFAFGLPVRVGPAIVAILEFFSDSPVRRDADLENLMVQVSTILGRAFERKEADDILLQSEERHRVLAETASDAIVTIDEKGEIVYANPSTARVFGHAPRELLGRNVTILMPGSLQNRHSHAFKRHVETGERHMSWDRVELTAEHQSGRLFPIDLSLAESNLGGKKFFTGIIRDVTERKDAEAALHKLSGRLLRLQDEERRKIARELHDSVGQLLAAISMNIGVIQSQSRNLDSRGAKAIGENAHLVQQVSDEIRTLSHLLHPPLLEIAGLDSALRWYVDGFSERSKIKVDLEIPADLQRLSQETELAIFRIVQECLTNIHRHSNAERAAICLRKDGRHLTVEIQDYGTGISDEKQRQLAGSGGGVGFAGMRERLRELGGTLEIESDEKGTLIRASFPAESAPDHSVRDVDKQVP